LPVLAVSADADAECPRFGCLSANAADPVGVGAGWPEYQSSPLNPFRSLRTAPIGAACDVEGFNHWCCMMGFNQQL